MKFKQVLAAATVVPLALIAIGCANDSGSSKGAETSTTKKEAATTTTVAVKKASGTAMGSPPAGDTSKLNIAQIAAGTPDVSTLTRLVILAGLLPTVATGGPFTVFAPANDAFAKVDPATLATVKGDTKTLQSVLTLHVVPGKLTTDDLKKAAAAGTSLTTVNGGKLKVEVKGEDIYVGGAKIIIPDIPASNGVVQVVDSVITAPNG